MPHGACIRRAHGCRRFVPQLPHRRTHAQLRSLPSLQDLGRRGFRQGSSRNGCFLRHLSLAAPKKSRRWHRRRRPQSKWQLATKGHHGSRRVHELPRRRFFHRRHGRCRACPAKLHRPSRQTRVLHRHGRTTGRPQEEIILATVRPLSSPRSPAAQPWAVASKTDPLPSRAG